MDNQKNYPPFYNKNNGISSETHSICMFKICNVTDDGMLACCNTSKSCNNIAHARCADLNPDIIAFLSFWYCQNCLEGDEALNKSFREELAGAIAISTLFEMIKTKLINPAEIPELMKYRETSLKLAEELSKALDELEARDIEINEAQQQIDVLKKQIEAKKPTETTAHATQTIIHSETENAAEAPSMKDVLQRAQFRRQSSEQKKREHQSTVVFNLPDSHRNQRYSTPFQYANDATLNSVDMEDHQSQYASFIAEAAHAYPDYEAQEVIANGLGTEQLALLRAHISDPQIFTGDVATWATFRTLFVGSSRRGHYRAVEDMERLRKLIGGDAYRMYGPEIVDPFAHPTCVLRKLDNFYGIKGNAVRHHLDVIWNLEPMKKPDNRESLLDLFASLKQYALLCRQYDQLAELTAESSLLLIESRMHRDHAVSWRNYASANRLSVSVDTIIVFLEEQLRLIQQKPIVSISKQSKDHVLVAYHTGGQEEENIEPRYEQRARRGSQLNSRKPQKCFNCRDEHPFFFCPELLHASYTERKELVKKLKICECCLAAKRHSANSCSKEAKCPVANCEIIKRHPLLHGHTNTLLKELGFIGTHKVMAANQNRVSVCFKIVPGHVVAENGDLLPANVLFDSGSSVSLSDMSLLSRAGWPSRKYELAMKWTSNVIRTEENARLHDVKFIPFNHKNPVVFKGVTAIQNLELPHQGQDPRRLKKQFPYLAKVPIPSYSVQSPQILLGLPHARFMATIQCIKDPQGIGPVAELSELGWTLSGKCSNLCIEAMQDPELVRYTFVHSNEPKDEENIDTLIEIIKQQFSTDSLGINAKQPLCLSTDDKKALDMIKKTLRFVPEEGRYEIGLLWRDENCSIPNNYQLAFNRLQAAEQRLKKLELDKTIIEQFDAEISSGQLVKVTREELKQIQRVNFVPGFVTFNYNKIPPKARWVNDTAAKFQGVSLNEKLLKGPDNLVPLPQALCTLREGKFAILADIKKMFNQIMLKKEDQYAQLCLWRDCDTSRDPEIYRQTRVIFGPNCSPASANSVRIYHAENSREKFPLAAYIALYQMYMDDVLDSRDSLEEAIKVANDLIAMFDEIGWELTQFQSNSKDLLAALPTNRINQNMSELGIDDGEPLVTKVLGMFFDPRKDHFIFKLNDEKLLKKCLSSDYHPTRKEMLSLVMRVYDPLGLIAHFIIHGRLLLQEICRRGVEWKNKIPDEMYDKWIRWLRCFQEISELIIPRRYTSMPLSDCTITLHLFVDASQEAYACALYLRFDFGTTVQVRLMAAKSRVAPIKHMTIPRLELNSALIGARLLKTAKQWHHRLNIVDYTAWSDSITVLRWLYAGHIRHKQFVAPRIAEIQELTAVNAWRYVPTDQNVADLATKWSDIKFSENNHRWFLGPEFLYKPQQEWPKMPEDFSRYNTDENDTNKSKCTEHVLISKSLGEINPWQAGIFTNVTAKTRSDWYRYTKIVAIALRFVEKLKVRISKNSAEENLIKLSTNCISPTEIHRAENLIIRQVQKEAFNDEYQRLEKGQPVSKFSVLKSLSPFLCPKSNIIRASTRLSESFPEDMRYPPILPNLHETSDAIVNYFHKKHNHVGDNAIIGSIRSRVWIVSARRAVRRARARCVYCIEKRAKPQVPEAAELPEFRLDATKKPFYYCGLDCFGPYEVYCGNSRRKKSVWMVIFTCLITRAVYLEVLDDMSTNCMITAIEKLWARRGPIGHFYSDNGRNFIGVSNILENALFQQKLAAKRVKWHFQPPYTPHFGGIWERLIKDIKRALTASVGSFPIPRLALESALAQIECNMNDRPLTDVAISPNDLEPLTPNLLMSGHNGYPFLSDHDITVDDLVSTKYVRCAKAVVQAYMKRWIHEALPEIAKHKQQKKPAYQIKINDYVIYIDPSKPPREWKRGTVSRVYYGKDRKVRVADVKINAETTLERRSVARLAKLDFNFENKEAEQKMFQTTNKNSKPVTTNEDSNVLGIFESSKIEPQTDSLGRRVKKFQAENLINSSLNSSLKAERLRNKPGNHEAIMSKQLNIVESPIGLLSDKSYDTYCNPLQDRIIYCTNLPPGAGICEIWQAFRSFGEIRTIVTPIWNGFIPFYAFIIFRRKEAAQNAIEHSRSFAIGLDSHFYRTVIEKPIKRLNPLVNRGTHGLERLMMQFTHDDITSKILIVRAAQGSLLHQSIPNTSNKPIVRRQVNKELMYCDVIVNTECENITDLSRFELTKKFKVQQTVEESEIFDIATVAHYSTTYSQADMDDTAIDLYHSEAEIAELESTPSHRSLPERQAIIDNEGIKRVKSVIVKPMKKRLSRKR